MGASNDIYSRQGIAAEAAEWFISLQGGAASSQERERFADWLRASPVHVEEFLQLTALQGDLARLTDVNDFDVDRALERLRTSAPEENVIALSALGSYGSAGSPLEAATRTASPELQVTAAGMDAPVPPRRQVETARRRWSARRAALAAAAVVALVAIGVWNAGPIVDRFARQHYKTDIGEQRSLILADGSQVELNALSNLSVRLDQAGRDLQLSDGEALFHVAKDPAHPFKVHTPQATIEAKGTQFNVRVLNGKTVVSLLEGHVLVSAPLTARNDKHGKGAEVATAVLLSPGEEISMGDAVRVAQPRKGDLQAATAWTEHRLVFEDAPLSDVIAEFNRYSRQPFIIDDPALRDVRITASFDAGSSQTFAVSLAAAGALRVTRSPSGAYRIERQ